MVQLFDVALVTAWQLALSGVTVLAVIAYGN